MKATALKLPLHHWPYGLEIQTAADGLLLRPQRKARAGWGRDFRRQAPRADELAPLRQAANRFDGAEWEW